MAGNILAVVVVAIACGVITARLRSRCRAALTV
jgi:Na+/H+-dicarboxylate symporter